MVKTVLGFDFGMQKIGIATGQTITRTASGLCILPAKDGIPDWQAVGHIIEEWRPDRLIVGLPLNMDGTESEMSRLARKFANRLTGRFNVPSEMIDERLTTREAREQSDQQHVDAVAARIILESWLATQSPG